MPTTIELSAATREDVRRVLLSGGVILFPTETFVGLGCRASVPASVERVIALKARPHGKGLPLIAADEGQVVRHCGPLPDVAIGLARRFWPGPLTLVLRAAEPSRFASGARVGDTVAIRVPGDPIAREVARIAGEPIVATSANLAGDPPVTLVRNVHPGIRDVVDLAIEGPPCPGGLPSSIVDASGGGARILRIGAIPDDDLLAVIEQSG